MFSQQKKMIKFVTRYESKSIFNILPRFSHLKIMNFFRHETQFSSNYDCTIFPIDTKTQKLFYEKVI